MYQDKIPFIYFFRTKRVIELADLIATKIERSELYYIHKDKGRPEEIGQSYKSGMILDKENFEKILSQAKNPIILSDIYIDLGLE